MMAPANEAGNDTEELAANPMQGRCLGAGQRDGDREIEEALNIKRQMLETIFSDTPLQAALDGLLRTLERQSPGIQTAILLLDADGGHLRRVAAPCLSAAHPCGGDGLAVAEGAGCCGTAAFRRELVVAEDTATDPMRAACQGLAATRGLSMCRAYPILDAAGAVLGTLAVHYPPSARPTPPHHSLADLATHLAAIAIARWREEEAVAGPGRQAEEDRHARFATLTEREREVLALALAGHVNKEIGKRLGISVRTVEHHRSHILLKTGAENLLHLVCQLNTANNPGTPPADHDPLAC